MRAVVQRVSQASVSVNGIEVSAIKRGILILAAVGKGDTEQDAESLARKLAALRIFEDEAGRMNLDLRQVKGEALVVSQFTLFGDCRKGNRPSFEAAELPVQALALFDKLVAAIAAEGIPVCTGQFRAQMQVSLINEGPVTILVDSRKQF